MNASILPFDSNSRSSNFVGDNEDGEEHILMAQESHSNEDVWFLDLGASSHMTSRKDWFSSIKKGNNKSKVILGMILPKKLKAKVIFLST